jgi:serine protease Do
MAPPPIRPLPGPRARGSLRAVALLALLGILPAAAEPAVQAPESRRRTPIVTAVERVAPATVSITSTQEFVVNGFYGVDPFFRDFFRRLPPQRMAPQTRTEQTLGTGTIIDAEGYVLTNEHVLRGAVEIQVALKDGRQFEGLVVGADPETDLAVIRIVSDQPLPVAPLGKGGDLMIGETVIAIGNAFGLSHTVTTGVLSAISRTFRVDNTEYHGFLQTDASINPGNSGGPLINLDGEVIGINTAIFREAEGIGFAIPIDRASRIMDDLIHHGEVVPVWLGLRLQRLTPELREALSAQSTTGAVIAHVFEGSPAYEADLHVGDIVRALDGSPVDSPRAYYEILRGVTEGDTANLLIERNGKPSRFAVRAEAFPQPRADELAEVMLGVAVEEMPRNGGAQVVQARGMQIARVAPRSPAALRGLLPGDVILEVDRDAVVDRDTFRRAITKLRGRDRCLLLVQRGRIQQRLPLVIE